MKVFASEKNISTTLCFKLQDRFVLFKHNLAVEIDGKDTKTGMNIKKMKEKMP